MRNLGQNNHIVNLLKASAAISFSIFLTACGDDSNKTSGGSVEDQEVIAISDKTISGVSQKGPFVNGSSVTVQELDGETLAQTGNSYEGKIKNDLGEFSVKVTKLASQYALLKANGFYRNEVSGEKSKSQVTLYAFTDLSDRDEVNVNLLTHLEYERSIYLATEDSMSVDSAKKQAEKEVLNSFGINGEFASAEDLNIFGNGDESAALLAISVLMQGDLKEADFTERLNNYAMEIETDGIWNDSITATVIADWASDKSLKGELEAIRQNIAEWKISEDVPDFEKYVNNYWWENYRLGVCNDKREGEVLQNSNAQSKKYKEFLICKNNAWRIASDLEYDTYEQKCDEDGKIIFGNVNKDQPYDCDGESWRKATEVEGILGGCIEKRFDEVAEALEKHYICEKREWRAAKDIEKDTYKWKDGKDADSKYGDVVKSNCYVYEDSSWRSGNEKDCALDLRGCTTLRQDTVGKGCDKVWYICDVKSWRNATTYEKDTFGWTDSTDGAIKKGNVSDTIYVFDKTAWRETSIVEAQLGGCVATIADSVGKVGSTYYICKSNKWVEASAIEYDTYRWATGKDGDSKPGSVNTNNCYVYENNVWRSGNTADCSLGLRGCTTLRQDTVGLGADKVWHICDTKQWRNATNIEKDTATWGAGKFDGEVRVGQVNTSIYYIYGISNDVWRNATTLEKDTYDYTNNKDWIAGTDGEIKKGSVTDSMYIYDASAWRSADEVEKALGGCVTAIADSVGKVGSTYYICTPRKWVVATVLQYDTYKKECLIDGSIVDGNVISSNKYVCDDGAFRFASENDIRAGLGCTSYTRGEYRILSGQYSYYKCETDGWLFTTERLNQGTMTDERDGHVYKTIGIKTQMWMAENLNYADSANYPSMLERNWCYDNIYDNCFENGRLYTWSAAIDSVYWAGTGGVCGHTEIEDEEHSVICDLPEKVKGICPEGWHLPSLAEINYTASLSFVYKKNMQAVGYPNWKNATDEYGFSAIPAGFYVNGNFDEKGSITGFWTSWKDAPQDARHGFWGVYFILKANDWGGYSGLWGVEGNAYVNNDGNFENLGFSVRCVKDED